MLKERVVEYIIKFDGEFHLAFSTLREARKYIRDLPVKVGIGNMPSEVLLVKRVEETQTLNVYTPKQAVVMELKAAFDDIDLA